jgi:prevent-host-death family protein
MIRLKNTVKAMKQIALSEIKDDLSKYLRLAENEEIIITKHGKPAGILVGFASEDDWFEYKLEHDPRFLQRLRGPGKACAPARGSSSRIFNPSQKGRRAEPSEASDFVIVAGMANIH